MIKTASDTFARSAIFVTLGLTIESAKVETTT
ncbi:MAG: hypothetical protein ACD_22C00076G0001 [uncultured bacterium]|nr:MAG: hypothetical protein ACD_22C00076G0001 [uncultured bacterium]